jgi:hypothetical protein
MRSLMAGVVGVGVMAAGAVAQSAVQWRVEDGGNGHWYRFVVATVNWTTAQTVSSARGGHLVTLSSVTEAQFVRTLGSEVCWIGLKQNTADSAYSEPAGGWNWVTSEALIYSDWRVNTNGQPNEPNDGIGEGGENWALLDAGGVTWNDVQDNPVASYCTEWSADCNGDGIVDYGQCRDGSLPDYNGNNIPDCCEAGTPCAVGSYPVQWRVEDGGNGHWYAIRPSGLPPFSAGNWEALRALALAQGGGLAQVETGAENLFVLRVLDPVALGGEVWAYLGATHDGTSDCSSTTWRWLDGSALTYLNWAPGQPNCLYTGGVLDEPRLAIRSVSGAWGDWSPVELTRGVVEWSADCNGDGIVDYGQILTGQLADSNQNGVPDACEADPCPGDITGNGIVNSTDLAVVLSAWGSDGQAKFDADVDNNGTVDSADLAFVLAGWGACP